MTIYSINPQSNVDLNNIYNIMTQLTNDISESIKSQYNIIIETQYILMIQNINQILSNYLKIYYFYGFNIRNIYVQIYNQNINLVSYVNIKIFPFKYNNITSSWNNFYNNIYYMMSKYVYNELDTIQKNDLRYAIISNKLYFIDNIIFTYNNLFTKGVILKPIYDKCHCEYTIQSNCHNCYITTVYWN